MSADNYSDCPRCHARRVREITALRERHAQDYGKQDQVAWLAGANALEEIPKFESSDGQEMRQNYEFYLKEKGVLGIHFSGHCDECGLLVEYDREHEFDISETD